MSGEILHATKVKEMQQIMLDEKEKKEKSQNLEYLHRISTAISEYKTALRTRLRQAISRFLVHPTWTYVRFGLDELDPNMFQGFKATTMTWGWYDSSNNDYDTEWLLLANNNTLPFYDIACEFMEKGYNISYCRY